ncbi:MAG: branched-chain amino acid ABC transporter permease [Chloroflexia bacterium]|nr:branched-chain amino acid ABC transporter permease [Chloroflexia bacterium]
MMFAAVNTGLLLKQLFNATSAVSLLALVAIGLFIIFGMMKVINMAHGELFMLGAYTMWWLLARGINFWLNLLAAALVVGLFGVIVERLIVQRLYVRGDLSTLLATFGLSILLQRGVAIAFGDRPQFVTSPFTGGPTLLGNTYPTYQIIATVLAFAVIAAVVVLFLKTDFGLRARATIVNPAMAAALAVNTVRMNALSFALGSALAGFAGALAAPLVSVVPAMGLDWVIRAFLVVIVAGAGSIWAAAGGAAIVGGWEAGFTAIYDATYAQITVLAIVWALVLLRPRGLFSGTGRRWRR